MLIKRLDVIIRRKAGRIIAVVRQMTPEGLQEGTNLLKKHRPTSYSEAKTLVGIVLGDSVEQITFTEERKDWEQTT